ncbi:hypothetical protein HA402_000858 [Bradysia odoriphaga]|nr:hypothetical protein HA402_000858 [Bradysia odoriphaga]
MFLDTEAFFDHPHRLYSPGDIVTCKINVRSKFNINCKYVRARFRCPFKSKSVEYFRVYEIARKRISRKDTDQWDYRIGEKAENVNLLPGLNQFIVTFKVPHVSYNIFEQHSNLIRCSLKVTVKVNWLFKRNSIDWFVLEPRTTEEVMHRVEKSASRVLNRISDKFRNIL